MRRVAVIFENFKRERDAMVVIAIVAVVAILAMVATAFTASAEANTSTRAVEDALVQMETPNRTARRAPIPSDGGLVLRKADGDVAVEVPAMRLGTDIVADITGQSARVTVTQAFRNTSEEWMEATYLYPLPENGAVDTLQMVVGDRIFTGRIKPKEEAREIYEEAKANGQKAALVEQHRPNMFENSIANVGPGETVLVQIEFQAPIAQVAGDYSLRMPLVVGPRYIASGTGAGGSLSLASLAASAGDLTAPTADPAMVEAAGNGLNPVSITVNLDPGFVAGDITSPYHPVNVTGSGERRTITLTDGVVPADRDFELRWKAEGDAPSLALYRDTLGELDYVMATITPPSVQRIGEAPPREMIFVIDNSGSMAGESMPAARRSLLYALDTLRPQDRFNIIRFDDTMTELFSDAVPATRSYVERARDFTKGLEAEGGTEMLPALRAALDWCKADSDVEAAACEAAAMVEGDIVRQVVFMTDGGLSNEAAMMEEINRNRGHSRVFMVGIGSAPNSYLMRRMAEAGRGTFTHVGISDEAEDQMRRLLDRLARPVATGLTATVEGGNIDFAPRDLPDLYAGEPLVLLGRTRHLAGTLTVSGMIGDERWTRTVNLTDASPSDAVAKLWAYRRIAEVEAERWSGEMSYERADKSIEELGMDFHLVTTRTSLIAVDETPTRPEGARLTREELPLLLPAGWDFDHLFGAQYDLRERMAADGRLIESEKQRQRLDLPKTSTGYALTLSLGLLLLLAGLVGLATLRSSSRRKRLLPLARLPRLQQQAA